MRSREWEGALDELNSWGIATQSLSPAEDVRHAFKDAYKDAFKARDAERKAVSESTDLKALKDAHHNDALHEWVMQTDRHERIALTDRGLVQETALFIRCRLDVKRGMRRSMLQKSSWVSGPSRLRLQSVCFVGHERVALLHFANRWPERWGWGKRLINHGGNQAERQSMM